MIKVDTEGLKTVGFAELHGVSRLLSGFDESHEIVDAPSARTISFILDGVHYMAVEDESDGYRSMMGQIFVMPDTAHVRQFTPVAVNVYERTASDADILDFVSFKTGKIILSIGTDYSDSYYPSFVSHFDAEALTWASEASAVAAQIRAAEPIDMEGWGEW